MQAAPVVDDVVLDEDVGLGVAPAVFREALDGVVAARARGRLEGVVVEEDRPVAALAVLDPDAGADPVVLQVVDDVAEDVDRAVVDRGDREAQVGPGDRVAQMRTLALPPSTSIPSSVAPMQVLSSTSVSA